MNIPRTSLILFPEKVKVSILFDYKSLGLSLFQEKVKVKYEGCLCTLAYMYVFYFYTAK